ncbi:LysR family transcriptional regulator [Bowmanella yangjiangensis]|uniref:LysR family transcriptional regulator n=1 Tax=Bowmanella yangjiangensis TaxID=2811230 RepID=A0ABS3D020_9ALTE|nr:LysR family transcriptional regulator [Bowmanella yangjiangensis]MBN7822165.1 LysR family transcriptional regulator [Bowmanella yangjiangensis]
MDKDIAYLLKVFCTVVEAGSLASAAERLDVQAPAISKALARLEILLGNRLLHRSTRALQLTDAGTLLYQEGMTHLLSLGELLDRVRGQNHQLSGSLNITATPAVGEQLITPLLVDFSIRYPQLQINLLCTNEQIRLPSQSVDMAIRSSRQLEDSSLTSQLLLNVRRLVVASPAYLQQAGTPRSPAQLAEHACLHFYHQGILDAWDYENGDEVGTVTTQSRIRVNSYASLKTLCLAGRGVARLFEYQVADELANGKLVKVAAQTNWGHQSLHAVYHGKLAQSVKLQAFVTAFRQRYGE